MSDTHPEAVRKVKNPPLSFQVRNEKILNEKSVLAALGQRLSAFGALKGAAVPVLRMERCKKSYFLESNGLDEFSNSHDVENSFHIECQNGQIQFCLGVL